MIKKRLKGRLTPAVVATLATTNLYAEGVLKSGWIEVALLAPVIWFLSTARRSASLQNALLSLTAVCFTLSALDVALRPFLSQRLHYTPTNIAARRLPQLPILGRWDPNMTFDVESYGDLAAMAGDPSLQERRQIVFRTDAFGFRNAADVPSIDLLVLGDSFGAGAGTTEDKIFARLLESEYGRHTYNLSYPGGPYDQYLNFVIESPRLTLRPDARLVWTFYTGNDMADSGGQTWDIDQLPWRRGFGVWLVTCRTYRNRSPLNQWMAAMRMRFSSNPRDVIVRVLPDGSSMLFQGGHEAWGMRSRDEVERHPNFAKLVRTMTTMQARLSERGMDTTVLIFPTKGEVYRWILEQRAPRAEDAQSSGFASAVLAACERIRLRCLDTKAYLVEEARRRLDSSGTLLWWRDDTHLGEHGHAAIAAFIAREVLMHPSANLH